MSKRQAMVAFCDFCGESQLDAELMVAGPGALHICDACVELAMNVVIEARKQREQSE